jgi:hypothetical protein
MEFAKLLDLYRPTYCNFPYQSVATRKIATRRSCRKRKRDAILTVVLTSLTIIGGLIF